MRPITFQHTQTKEVRTTRDFTTARAMMNNGWVVVAKPPKVKEGEAKRS